MGGKRQRFKSWLASPRAPRIIVLLAVMLVLPSLRYGLAADDHFQKLSLLRAPEWQQVTKPWYRLFTFYDGDPARTHRLVDIGMSPWWTDPSLRLSFFRPVSAATHLLDYWLWPSHPLLMHAQSVLWYAALVAVAAWLYRRFLGRDPSRLWIANLGALLYAFDHTHGVPVGWVANRNALVAAAFALASIGAYDVAVRREEQRRFGGTSATLASCTLFVVALGAGEAALGAVGYFVAHAIFLDARAWKMRITSLLPHALAAGAWALVYRAGDYGARGSGMYLEPLRDPIGFAGAVPKHLPLLVAAELGAPTPDFYTFVPLPLKVAFVVLALVFLAWSATAIARLWRLDPVARFFVVGSVLATVPSCATFPSGRLTLVGGFGLIGLVAMVGAAVIDPATDGACMPARGWSRRLPRAFGIWACGGHLVLSPPLLQLCMLQMVVVNGVIARMDVDLPPVPDPHLQRIVFINAPDAGFAPYVFLSRHPDGEETATARFPSPLLTMASGARNLDLRRTDERTLVLRVDRGFYRYGTELLMRGEDTAMPVGTRVALTGVTVEVLATAPDGVPTEASFRFDESVDSDAYRWEQWMGRRVVDVRPPAIGEHVTMPAQVVDLF